MEIVTLINFQCGKIDFNQVPVSKKGLNMFKVQLSFLISNILFKIVVNDVLNNLSMMVVTSLKSPGPYNKEIIEYDLEENIYNKFININFRFLFQIFSLRSWSMMSSTISL